MTAKPTVMGVHAPPPKPTAWAALLLALALCLVFLAGLAAIRLLA